MEKIKINLDKNTISKLNNDMILFKFFKENKQVNKNGFLNTLLYNYFPIYDAIASKSIAKYNKIISSHISNQEQSQKIINSLISKDDLFSFNKKDYLESSLSFKPSNLNKKIINIIIDKYTSNQSISSFFRNMLKHYLQLPQYKREQIIYANNYSLIQEAIESKRKIVLYINENKVIVSPFKITTNNEELYNYLVCLTNEERKNIMSIHLYKIDYIYFLQESVYFDELDKNKLEKVVNSNPQFPHYNDKNTIIELNKCGIKMFENKYLNRPSPYKIENNRYYFDCSYNQIVVYFFPFAKNAKIIEPLELKETLKKMYLEAYNNYIE